MRFMHTEVCFDIHWDAPVISLPLSTQTDLKSYYLSDHSGYHGPFQLALPHISAVFHTSSPTS